VVEERNATSSDRTGTCRHDDRVPEDWIDVWPEQPGVGGRQQIDYGSERRRIIGPEIKWSEMEKDERTVTDRAVALDGDLSGSNEQRLAAGVNSVDEARWPMTVCHVRVTVRHTSPRPTARDRITDRNQEEEDSRETTPVPPAIRRAGAAASKRSSPAGRRVTFSPTVDDRAAPRYQHNAAVDGRAAAALDTLWHYHDSYPCVETRHVIVERRVTLASDGGRAAGTASSVNASAATTTGSVNPSQSHDVVTSSLTSSQQTQRRAAVDSPAADDDASDQQRQHHEHEQERERQEGSGVVDDADETTLSIKQLVASFENMTSPYMRAPVIARRAI